MGKITKLLLSALLLIGGSTNLSAQSKITLDQLKAANGTDEAWLAAIPASYPVNVTDQVVFGSDASSQVTNANVDNYDYLYVTVSDFTAKKAVRIFFWDPIQNKRIDYFLKPVEDKETADFTQQTDIEANGSYCVKIPDGARLQGSKAPWGSSADVSFKFSEIYLTERATPYVPLVPYTLVYSEGKAIIPISESHIRTTGNVSINYETGEITNTGSGELTIYLNNENLIGATLYHVDFTGTNLEPILQVTDAVNGEVGGIYTSRFNWSISSDGTRKNKVGSVTALRYQFSAVGSMTFTSIYIVANELIAETTNIDITSLPYGRWSAPANKLGQYIDVDSYKTNNIDGAAHNDVLYGHDGNVDANKYVDLTNCSKIIFTGFSSNATIRLFYNWSGTDVNKPIEVITDFPTVAGEYVFDIDAFKKAKGISFFHLNGIKSNWDNVTLSDVTVVEYTNKISGSGIDRTKTYLTNPYITAIDATGVTSTGVELVSANPNALFLANEGALANTSNVIVNGTCANLVLTDGYAFKAPADFTATSATYNTTIDAEAEAGTLCLPFAAAIPDGVEAYTLNYTSGDKATATPVETTIPANTPVLLNGNGEKTFTGSGAVVADASNVNGALTGVFAQAYVPQNSYVLQYQDPEVGFFQVAEANSIQINPFRAYLTAEGAGARLDIEFTDEVTGIEEIATANAAGRAFNLAGQRVANPTKGLYIQNGKKVLVK